MSEREWLSIEIEQDQTVLFDLSFLASSFTCIWGAGCQGVRTEAAPELVEGCCAYGAHYTDDNDRERTEHLASQLTDAEWQFRQVAIDEGTVSIVDDEGTWTTRLVDDSCIFLNRPDFEGGPGCALHGAAMARGERPLDWKPEVCWQVPLRLSHAEDEAGHTTSTLTDWKRRDWGDGGVEFHWWCTESPEAFVGADPTYVTLRDEIIELVGQVAYDGLDRHLSREVKVELLAHPTLRNQPEPPS